MLVVVAGPRYPLAALQRAAKAVDLHVLARRLGLTHGTVRNAGIDGLTDEQADQWAVRLGLHPAHVWSRWGYGAPDEVEFREESVVVETVDGLLIVGRKP